MREIGVLPDDCRSLLPPHTRGTYQRWQVFVTLEHCDRIKRLRRIAERLPPDERPRFFEDVVPAGRLPSEFGVDLPVLRVVFPERTFFDTDRSTLRPEAEEIALVVADNLRREPPDVALFVAGHADERGDRAHNEALSIDRANAIGETIFRQGAYMASVWRIGFGEDMPLDAGHDMAAYARNRRVEFLFAARPEAVGTWLADQQLGGLCQARTQRDANQCKAALDLKPDYVALEVVRVRSPSLRPNRLGEAVNPVSKRGIGVAPATSRAAVDPKATGGAHLGLRPARRIHIDPVRRKSGSVSLDL